jgi:hypothetical protein
METPRLKDVNVFHITKMGQKASSCKRVCEDYLHQAVVEVKSAGSVVAARAGQSIRAEAFLG